MTLRPGFRWALLGLSAVLVLSWRLNSWREQVHRVGMAEALRAQTTVSLRRANQLAAMSPQVEVARRPEQDLFAPMQEVLSRAGLPSSHLRSIEPEGDRQLVRKAEGSSMQRVQTARLELSSLLPRELGEVLEGLRSGLPAWGVSRLEVVRSRDRGASSRHDVSLWIEAKYLADAAPPLRERNAP